MKIDTISILPMNEIRIIKQILIVSELESIKDYTIGYILYERLLTQDYKFKETPKEERDFTCYHDYSKQDSYPNDEIDIILLQSIKNLYPKSCVRNHSLICNVDKEKIKVLQNRPTEQGEITLTPDFSQTKMNLIVKNFSRLKKEIKIYKEFTKESIKNIYFQGYYDLERPQVLDLINEIQFI